MTASVRQVSEFDETRWGTLLSSLAAEHDVPAAAVAVLHDERIHDVAAGVINRRTGVEATTDTLFQIGSISKVWTTTLLLGLADEQRVDLDAAVRAYVPELALADEAVAATLTVRQLLNHTSGLPGDFFPDTGRGDDCLAKYVAILADVELAHPPGAMFSYSNAAFILAGLVIERVTGTTWDAALRSRLIEPLDLTMTVTLPEEALLHRTAVGHVGRGDNQTIAPQWVMPRNCGPAGLIASRARDLIEFARLHLDHGRARNGTQILSEEAVRAMQQVTVSVPGASQGRFGFGLGWGLGSWSGSPVLQHDGGTIGQAASLRVLPQERFAVAVLTNGGDFVAFRDAVLSELVPLLAGVVPTATPQPAVRNGSYEPGELVGMYRNLGSQVEVTWREGGLWASQRTLDKLEALTTQAAIDFCLVPQGDDVFLVRPPGASTWAPLVFLRDTRGAVEYMHVGGRAARRQPSPG
jgi:CubicO group peptidase (beta-lactamase class C family)